MTADGEIILQEIKAGMVKANSPWLSKEDAAAYAGNCCTKSIDDAANAGLIKRRYPEGHGRPVFERKSIDAWIESGKAVNPNPRNKKPTTGEK